MQMLRAATARRLAQYRNAIASTFGRIVPQRIPPPQPTGRQLDMRACREPWQIAAAWIYQLIAVDVLGEIGNRSDAQLHGPRLLQISAVLGKDRADIDDLSRGGP